ncbi:MAG: GHKL domain-containing protein [Oscillospiraceae bacterium]|nr:GHKL domain-containing protein [Oscillospiraceae bacterium]
MNTALRTQVSQKWLPFVTLPLFFAAYFLLLLLLIPADTRPELSGIFPGVNSILAMGSYLALFLVHFLLFLVIKSYKANLLYSLVCLIWLLSLGIGLTDIFPLLSPSPGSLLSVRFTFLAMPVIAVLVLYIIRRLFPDILQKWFIYAVCILMGIFFVVFLIFDENFLQLSSALFPGVLLLALLYFIVRLIIKLRKIQPEQVSFFIGAAIFIYGAMHDVLLYNNALPVAPMSFNHNYLLMFSLLTSVSLMIATTREIIDANADRQQLAAQELITENQLDFQREQFGRLVNNLESVKFMRHDMKHHLAVINEYAHEGNISGISGYLEGLELGLRSSKGKVHCDNYAVNAMVNHYLGTAERDEVMCTINLTVPENTGQVSESDLCVIVGNLLENAIDACRTLPDDERFIRLFSYVSENILTFTMENSFDGELNQWGDVFYSTKRDGEGIGLSSVHAVATRYDGDSRFEANGGIFFSSVYVNIEDIQ